MDQDLSNNAQLPPQSFVPFDSININSPGHPVLPSSLLTSDATRLGGPGQASHGGESLPLQHNAQSAQRHTMQHQTTPIQAQQPHAPSSLAHAPYGMVGAHMSQGASMHRSHGAGVPGQRPLPVAHHGGILGQVFSAPSQPMHAPPVAGPGLLAPVGHMHSVSRMTANPPLHPMHRPQQPYLSFEVPVHPEIPQMKLTRGTSCVLCQQRKVRCDRNKPCANCVKAGIACHVVPPQPPRRRKRRPHERDLVDRLRSYESLLAKNGIKFESIEGDLRKVRRDGAGNEDEVDNLDDDFQDLQTSPEPSGSSRREQPRLRAQRQASDDYPHDSSDEEEEEEENYDGSTMQNAFDEMYGGQEGFPFFVGGRNQPVTHLHPPVAQIFQLWQIYLRRVNPLLRITHVPTVQAMITNATANLNNVPKNLEALMFTIYFMAVSTLNDNEAHQSFGAAKMQLLVKFHTSAQQALVNAGFMRANDILTLTAFVLYLFSIRQVIDPRQIFSYSAVAVRAAQRMGLHQDGAVSGLSPYEVELRRRLWWTLVAFDRRMSEIAGCPISALSVDGNSKLPLNINDNDIHVDATEAPVQHHGPTEMLFSLIWLELAMAIPNDKGRDGLVVARHDKVVAAPPPSERVVRRAHQADSPIWTIDGFCAHIEGTYLHHCRPQVPFHMFTLHMTRQALCKMRIISFLMRMIRHPGAATPSLSSAERDSLLNDSVQMIEHDNSILADAGLDDFKWYTFFHFPFPAYLFLMNELKRRTTGPEVEHAWHTMSVNHEVRNFAERPRSPMHLSFGPHLMKAFYAHVRDMERIGKRVTNPRWIVNLEMLVEQRSAMGTTSTTSPSMASHNDVTSPQLAAGRMASEARPPPQPTSQQERHAEPHMIMTPPEDSGGAYSDATTGTTTTGTTTTGTAATANDNDVDWAFLMHQYQQYQTGNMPDLNLPFAQDDQGGTGMYGGAPWPNAG